MDLEGLKLYAKQVEGMTMLALLEARAGWKTNEAAWRCGPGDPAARRARNPVDCSVCLRGVVALPDRRCSDVLPKSVRSSGRLNGDDGGQARTR